LHKIALLIKTIIAPEFIAVEAAQEWTQARRIVRQCSEYTNGEMKLVHAFYIGMLGVRYRVSSASKIQDGSHAKVLWPTQFVWLLQTGHIRWNDLHDWGLAEESINDKSNADSMAKLLALGGVAKFCIDCLLRAYHRLPISALESMTLGYIPLFALSYFFWWLKPKDIDTPSIIDLPAMEIADRREFDELALSDAFDLEGKPHQGRLSGAWCLMPRDFEREVLQQELIDIQHARFGEGRVVSHWDPDLYHSKLWPIACIFWHLLRRSTPGVLGYRISNSVRVMDLARFCYCFDGCNVGVYAIPESRASMGGSCDRHLHDLGWTVFAESYWSDGGSVLDTERV
jgi:hypothetical protein